MVTQPQPLRSAPTEAPNAYNRLFDFERRERCYHAGEQLFAEGDSAFFVYWVVRGVVRCSRSLADGRRFVDAFRVHGDLVGFDVEGVRKLTADAITDVFVSIARLDTITRPAVNHDAARELLAATSLELERVQRHATLLAMKAHQRVAYFLLEMSNQLGQPEILEIAMSRQDIADYLGLTAETVCRVLNEFDRLYLIVSHEARHIALPDPAALRRVAELGRSSGGPAQLRSCESRGHDGHRHSVAHMPTAPTTGSGLPCI